MLFCNPVNFSYATLFYLWDQDNKDQPVCTYQRGQLEKLKYLEDDYVLAFEPEV